MASLQCHCGYLIVDRADNLAYKGRILRDQDADHFFDYFSRDIASFVTALVDGTQHAWLVNHFTDVYPTDTSTEGVIHDLVAGAFILRYSLMTYQCEQCGRVWVQEQPRSQTFRSFAPDRDWKDTFAVREAE
jgi:hypothetical protein